jgi:hypothetical protein
MITLIRQLALSLKNLLGGASALSVNGLIAMLPAGVDWSFLTSTTNILGIAVPSFFIYLFLFSD